MQPIYLQNLSLWDNVVQLGKDYTSDPAVEKAIAKETLKVQL